MSWAVGFDMDWNRWIGYGVVAYCDHPKCNEEIDRGLGYVCGSDPYGGEHGCGLYFCEKHLFSDSDHKVFVCEKCCKDDLLYSEQKFDPKSEHPKWIEHIKTNESWKEWRRDNSDNIILK